MMQTNAPLYTVHKSSAILRKHSGSVSPAIPEYGSVNFIHEQRSRNKNNAINIEQITKPCKFYLVILPQIFIYTLVFPHFHLRNSYCRTVFCYCYRCDQVDVATQLCTADKETVLTKTN